MLENFGVIIIVMVVVAAVYWAADALPVPQPLNQIVKVGSVLVAIFVVVWCLLSILGMAPGGGIVPKV